MKLTKQRLKEIIKEEISQTMKEIDSPQNQSEKLLGDMNVRLEPYLNQLNDIAEATPGTEGKFLRKLWTELNMHFQSSYKYRKLGEKR